MSTEPVPVSYAADFTFDPPAQVARWRAFGNAILAIPHFMVSQALSALSQVLAVISWFAIVFTGRAPEGLAGLQALYLRYTARTMAYGLFMREEYPPFRFEPSLADPGDDPRLRLDVAPQLGERNRVTVFFRLFLAIPHFIALAALSFAAFVVTVIAFFAVLFTGAWPEGMRAFVVKVGRWSLRVTTYMVLLTDEYPPFRLE